MANPQQELNHKYNLVSVAVFFAMLIAIIVGLVGVIISDTTPWVLLIPTAVAAWSITTFRD